MPISTLETQFEQAWLHFYPHLDLHSQWRFHPSRRYRFDYAHLSSKVAIEVNGGRWIKSGHSSGRGIERDCMKSCLAASLGWLLFPITDSMLVSETPWLGLIAHAIAKRSDISLNPY